MERGVRSGAYEEGRRNTDRATIMLHPGHFVPLKNDRNDGDFSISPTADD